MDDKVIVAAIFAVVIIVALLLFRGRVKVTLSGPFRSKLTLEAWNFHPRARDGLAGNTSSRKGRYQGQRRYGKAGRREAGGGNLVHRVDIKGIPKD
jgi:hypothetical protein